MAEHTGTAPWMGIANCVLRRYVRRAGRNGVDAAHPNTHTTCAEAARGCL